jgi:hypothetical protein
VSDARGRLAILAEEVVFGVEAKSLTPETMWNHPKTRQVYDGAQARFDQVRGDLELSSAPVGEGTLEDVAFRAVRDELLPNWSSVLLATTPEESINASGRTLFREVHAVLRRYYYMSEDWHYIVATLFVFQAHVAPTLRRVFGLFIPGNMSTGKTEFEGRMATLTNGVLLQDFSVAYLGRALSFGKTAIFDEFDIPRNPEQEASGRALIRSSYKADAPKYRRMDSHGAKPVEFDVFGPRMVAYRGKLDDALQSRGFVIPTVRPKGEEGFDLVLLNMWPELGDLPNRLEAWGKAAMAVYTAVRQREIAFSPEFRARVRASVEELGANRESELVATATIVAEMVGVNVIAELRAANEVRKSAIADAEGSDLPALADAIAEVVGVRAKKLDDAFARIRVRQKSVKDALNKHRKELGERPISDRDFAEMRRKIGVEDAWLSTFSGHALAWSLPDTFLARLAAEYPGDQDGSVGSDESDSRQRRKTDPSDASYPVGQGAIRTMFRRANGGLALWPGCRAELAKLTGLAEGELEAAFQALLAQGDIEADGAGFRWRHGSLP